MMAVRAAVRRRGLSSASSAKKSKAAAAAATATVKVRVPFKLHRIDEGKGPAMEMEVTKEQLLSQFEELTYHRRMELVAFNLYQNRKIRGFCHLYDGQEAITVGMAAGLGKDKDGKFTDSVISGYRVHTLAVERGASARQVLAELMGRATGTSKGKGGSMHFYNSKNNFYGGNGIVGAQVPVGAGVGYAHAARGYDGVCFAMYGDGAANQGQIYEAANMAALWKLPVIFACENNQYGMGTSTERSAAWREYYKRGDHTPGVWVDGMDVVAVQSAVKWAKEFCTTQKSPLFMEFNTYRYRGHSMSDPGVSYRARDEIDSVKRERDCIEAVKNRLIELEWATAAELKATQKRIEKDIAAELKQAEADPEPEVGEVYTDVYVEGMPEFTRAVEYEDSIRQ